MTITATEHTTVAGLTADQADYLRETIAPIWVRYMDGVTTLPGDAVIKLAMLPSDDDGHFDGDNIWIGGTDYAVTLRPESLTYLNVQFALACQTADDARVPDGLWAILAASLTDIPGVEWLPNHGCLRITADDRPVLTISVAYDGIDYIGVTVAPAEGAKLGLGLFELTCSIQDIPVLLPGVLAAVTAA